MNFAACDIYRTMRGRLQSAIRRGRLAVIDVGSSQITCLILKLDADSLNALAPAAMTLAEAEGLEAHRRSVSIRLNPKDGA